MVLNVFRKLVPVVCVIAWIGPCMAQVTADPPKAAPVESPSATTAATPPQASPAPVGAKVSAEQQKDLRGLLDSLTDDSARTALIAQLRALLAVKDSQQANQPGASSADLANGRDDWLAGATRSLGSVSASILQFVADIQKLPELGQLVLAEMSDPAMRRWLAEAMAMIVTVLAAALLVEWLAKRLLAHPRRSVETRISANILIRLLLLCLRTFLDVLPIAAFAATAYGVLALVELGFLLRFAVVTLVNANVLSRAILASGRAMLAPEVPGLRLFQIDDESAAYGFLWLKRFTHAGVYGYFILHTAWLLGLSWTAYSFFANLLALFITGMSIVFVLQIRRAVSRWLRGRMAVNNVARLRGHVAEVWHVVVIAYAIGVYLVWVTAVPGGFSYLLRASLLSALTIALAGLVLAGLMRTFATLFDLSSETRAKYPLLEARANSYLPAFRQLLRSLVVAISGLALIEIWGGHPLEWLASTNGQGLLGRFISIGVVLLISLVALEVGTAFGERMAQRNPSSMRLRTLLPFLLNAYRIFLLTVASLIVLSELGVNIAPLLAGAGVFGLAVGFGAQTLVKDVITGIFILLENTISVGDVVEVGAHSGLVEKISVRTLHLRDFDGNVHSIPFGEVQTVKNMSKVFAYAVVDVTVSYRENIDEALAVMAEVAAGMVDSGPLAETIIAPFEVVGVEGLQDSAVWLRGRFKTRPPGQWNVRREFYRRIKAAFDERGIEIPFPHRTIYMGVDKRGAAPPLHVVNEPDAATRSRGARRKPAAATEPTTGPLIEEHPGARERNGSDDEMTLIEEQSN
ncbi:MAG TPA: mechanosensitive ion channel domain-containing protein [Bradyrhizobium sp.]